MKKIMVNLVIICMSFLCLCTLVACKSNNKTNQELSPGEIFNKVNPCVVSICIKNLHGFTYGTGFFIDEIGTVITNYQIIKDGIEGKIQLNNGSQASIEKVLGFDESLNIAILETSVSSSHPAEIETQLTAEIGDTVYTIGYTQNAETKDLVSSFNTGIISSFPILDQNSFIQSNIEIEKSNDGGPLINSYGRIIGITSTNLIEGLAIPYQYVDSVAREVNESLLVVTKRQYPVYARFYVGENLYESQKLKYEQTASKPTTPEKDGYTFNGWYTDKEFLNPFDFSTKIIEETFLYAKFTINQYSILYHLNSGEWPNDTDPKQSYTILNCGSLLPKPVREGYLFEGWQDDTGNYIDFLPLPENLKNLSLQACWIQGTEGILISNGIVNDYNGAESNIIIPETYREVPVSEIGSSAFKDCDTIKSVKLHNNIITIGDEAFSNCVFLENIQIPISTLHISETAFIGCVSLTKVSTSAALAKILAQQLTNLQKVIVTSGNSIAESTFSNCQTLLNIDLPASLTSIEKNAFLNCKNLSEIIIPNSVTSIGDNAFTGCDNLNILHASSKISSIIAKQSNNIKELYITSGNYIESFAFYSCQTITNVILSNSIVKIQNNAFERCSNLTCIVIPDSVTDIGESVFEDCINLNNISLSKNISEIKNSTFYRCSKLTALEIPDKVVSLGDSAFYGCSQLINIQIPNKIVSIGNSTFKDCKNLKNFLIPETVTSIGLNAFDGCINLIENENGVVYLDNWVVGCNSNIISANLRDGITGISNHAFYECTALTKIIIPNSIRNIGVAAFMYCNNLIDINIPEGVKSIEASLFYGCTNLETIYIPDSIISIGEGAFGYCNNLVNITLPDNIVSIGESAFRECTQLLTIEIPSKVIKIENYTFMDCYNLNTVVLPNGIVSIGEQAFDGCKNLSSINLPDSVISIKLYAFSECSNLTTIIIPKSTIYMEHNVFSGCYKLTIYIEAIKQPSGWDYNWNPVPCPIIWGYNSY